jgi:hypothetical protein
MEHLVKRIVTDPSFGPMTSPAFVAAPQSTFVPLAVSTVLASVSFDVNGFGNGPTNSGSAAAAAVDSEATSTAQTAALTPTIRIGLIARAG